MSAQQYVSDVSFDRYKNCLYTAGFNVLILTHFNSDPVELTHYVVYNHLCIHHNP